MKYLKFIIQLITIIGLIVSCTSKQQSLQKITLVNNSSVDLKDKAIAIVRDSLKLQEGTILYPLLLAENGDTISSQLDDLDGNGMWDQLFFVADIAAQSTLVLNLQWIKEKPEYTIRTSVKFGKRSSKDTPVAPLTIDTLPANKVHKALGYQPYQTDGPFWENDKVGFRHYFDGRNSKDLFGKKVTYMSPENVGINEHGAVEDNYHVMADWGRDILAVGNAVGIGGFGMMIEKDIFRLGITNDDSLNNIGQSVFKIVSEGPVHTIMNFQYQNWQVNGRIYQADEITRIWPGMYAFNNSVKLTGLQGDETLLVGLVNINTDQPLTEININDKYVILYTHDKQTYDKVWYLGLALILPKETYIGFGEAPKEGPFSNTFYGMLKVSEGIPVDYYAVGAWELSDQGFTDHAYFRNYVENLAHQLAVEVEVRIE